MAMTNMETEQPQLEVVTTEQITREQWLLIMNAIRNNFQEQLAQLEGAMAELQGRLQGIENILTNVAAIEEDSDQLVRYFKDSKGSIFYGAKPKDDFGSPFKGKDAA